MSRSHTQPDPAAVASSAPTTRRLVLAKADPGVFAELLRLFEWGQEPAHRRSLASLERAHLEAVVGRLNAHLAPDVRAELEALPDDAYLSLVRSPEAYHAAFYRPVDQLSAACRTWIAVARARLGAPTALQGTTRAAEHDRLVSTRDGRVLAVAPLPRLAGGVVLDVDSDLPARLLTRFPEHVLVSPSPAEVSVTIEKLDDALGLLRAMSSLASELVLTTTQVICARSAPGDPRFYTASDGTTLGVVHLVNTHLPRKVASEIASELVREAIHQALFRWELRQPLLADPRRATAKVRSPWTGATLDLYAFLHACFVWYGVANLWRLPTAPADAAITRQRLVSEAGFTREPLTCLHEHRAALSPALRAALAEMTRRITHLAAPATT